MRGSFAIFTVEEKFRVSLDHESSWLVCSVSITQGIFYFPNTLSNSKRWDGQRRFGLAYWFFFVCVLFLLISLTSNEILPLSGTELNYVLRNWNLEGSSNGSDWNILRSHRHDSSIAVKEFASASWTIDSRGVQYSTFRIVGTGIDSGGQNFVHFGSIEIWGKMIKPDEAFLG